MRIEPNNPSTLHYLGQVRFQQGQFDQAVALARRSIARARNDAELRNRNLKLIQASQQAMGPGVSAGSEILVEVDEPAEIRVGLDQKVDSRHQAGIAATELVEDVQPYASTAPANAAGAWQAGDDGGLRAVSFEERPAYVDVTIPRGMMPPRGKCRIWFPNRPTGHQPAPGKCSKLQKRVPQGAYLVRG
ncbi:hypothetical protein D9M70_542490 [compost metagenome]